LTQLFLPGAVALWCALVFALAAAWGYARLLRGDESARAFARRAYRFFALALVLASAVLLVCLARRDFRIEYVAQYSGLELPWYFQLAAFWAGQKGSFLIWLLWGALLGIPLYKSAGERDEAPVMGVYLLTLLGLLFILVRENPFVMLDHAPVDGQGLNPLLQDNWMVIHPPIMFVGYALAAIPFAFSVAALWRRQPERWAARAFPWALAGFLVLGTAILMGGYWAYKTLGWGGYWGWDPVENASLIPWIFGTALIHGLHMERAKSRYRRANHVLAALVYLAVLYGTFLTRSGVLADFSVHSFVDLGISGWLVALMGFFAALALYLLVTRLRQVPTASNEDSFLSRGSFMMLATITLLASAAAVLAGTSAPLLTRFLPNPGQVGPDFYNRVNLPVALLIAALLAVVPYLTWKDNPPRQVLRRLVWPGAAALAVTVGFAAWAVRDPFHLAFVFLAVLALTTNLHKTILKWRAGGMAGAGGYLAHVGVGVILIGILASSAYDRGAKITLELNVPQKVEDLTLTFTGFLPAAPGQREGMEVRVVDRGGEVYHAYPRLFMNERTRQLMVHPHIEKLALVDLYLSPIEFDPGRPPGEDATLALKKGETARVGETELHFVGFDLQAEGNALAQMESGGPVTVGAALDVRHNGTSERALPLYRFQPDGRVESPAAPLRGGGTIFLTGINATDGSIQLVARGLAGASAGGLPPKLSLDVTKKPLINLVWYGLYIVLAGGGLAAVHRLRQARVLDRVPDS
jgi:cytochrome c-type biogenesis protein CcmF